ncbi:MAG TPA: ATP-binding cassette domain-containing protein [Chloroflexia bacterium]|nr:ATP-binding cassette domain-containing protein [Chloroflexia bacterium]
MTSVAPVIVARNLKKQYKDFEAVKGIDFTVTAGECFGMLGPNGAGKSTTIRMLHCVSPPTSGELTVLGLPVTGPIRQIKARIGVVPQADNLDPDLTVRQNLLVYARYFDIPKAEAARRADTALDLFQLAEKRDAKVEEISGGMKRRLVIARALINNPSLIILDEPTTGLDPQARHLVWQKLRYLKEQGTTMVLTTHYMEEAVQLCDRLVIMNEGLILAEGPPAELVQRLVGHEVAEVRLPEAERPALLARLPAGIEHEESGDTLYLFARSPGGLRAVDLNALPYALHRQASLEDVFLRLTGRGLAE